jgi:hypothetical protein
MPAPVVLALSGNHHERLTSFLFPGDGKEAVATNLQYHMLLPGSAGLACLINPLRRGWPG